MKSLDTVISKLSEEFTFRITDRQKELFKSDIQEKYLNGLITNLEGRFNDVGVLSALATILNPQKALSCPSEQFSMYGDGEIATISTHFTVTVVNETLLNKGSCFKHLLLAYARYMSHYLIN